MTTTDCQYDISLIYLDDAIHCRDVCTDFSSETPWKRRLYKLFNNAHYERLYLLVVLALLILAGFEKASSFSDDGNQENKGVEWIEFGCLLFCSLDSILKYMVLGDFVMKSKWFKARAVILPIMVICCIFRLFGIQFGLARVLRPFLLIDHLKNVRRVAMSIGLSVPKILYVMVLITIHILLFGVIAYLLFQGIDEDNCSFGNPPANLPSERCSTFSLNCTDYFRTFWEGVLQLLILLTTANYPDVMLPAVDCSYWSAVFFIVYLLVGLYFLLSLIMAVAYNHFQKQSRSRQLRRMRFRSRALNACFDALMGINNNKRAEKNKMIMSPLHDKQYHATEDQPTSLMSRELVRKAAADLRRRLETTLSGCVEIMNSPRLEDLAKVISESNLILSAISQLQKCSPLLRNPLKKCIGPEIFYRLLPNKMPKRLQKLLFNCVNISGTGFITKEEFQHAAIFCEVSFTLRVHKKSFWPNIRTKLSKFIQNQFVAVLLDIFVILNAGTVLVNLSMNEDFKGYETLMNIFLVIFSVELLVKMFAFGPRDFWHSLYNRLDLLAVSSALISLFLTYETSDSQSAYSRTLLIFRFIRILRVFRLSQAFTIFLKTSVSIISPAFRCFAVLLAVYYVFAIVGMELFAGVLTPDDPAVVASSYGIMNFWSANFDTLHGAVITLFELMVVNNWVVTMEGCIAGTSDWAIIYFVLFFFASVIVVLNVVTAFMIDAYHTIRPLKELTDGHNVSMDNVWKQIIHQEAAKLNIDISKYFIRRPNHVGDTWELMYWNDVAEPQTLATIIEDDNAKEHGGENHKTVQSSRMSTRLVEGSHHQH